MDILTTLQDQDNLQPSCRCIRCHKYFLNCDENQDYDMVVDQLYLPLCFFSHRICCSIVNHIEPKTEPEPEAEPGLKR